jgi:hypothetical protein
LSNSDDSESADINTKSSLSHNSNSSPGTTPNSGENNDSGGVSISSTGWGSRSSSSAGGDDGLAYGSSIDGGSTLSSSFLELPSVGIAAAGAASAAAAVLNEEAVEWECLSERSLDMSWTKDVLRLLEYFTERTPGSVVEIKDSCVAWHYRDCDVGHGNWQVGF